jgi:TonB family protein
MAARRRWPLLPMIVACACAAPPATRSSAFPPPNPGEPPPGVLSPEEATTSPEFISGPYPTYTVDAIKRRVQGTALLRCVLTERGTVTGCRVIDSLPGMDAEIIRALEQRRYKPATVGGRPVAVFFHFKVTMRLPD